MTAARRALLPFVALLPLLPLLHPPPAGAQPDRQVLLVLIDGVAYERVLTEPFLAGLASHGGVGLMTTRVAEDEDAREAVVGDLGDAVAEAGVGVASLRSSDPERSPWVEGIGLVVLDLGSGDALIDGEGAGVAVEALVRSATAGELLVMVVVPSPSSAMRERGDQVTPMIAARGAPEELLEEPPAGLAGLTSETTDRAGLVANVDVAPTALDFLGVPVPSAMDGAPVRVEGDAPGELHQRYLGVRRIRFPLQMVILGVALAALLAAALALSFRDRAPRPLRRGVAWSVLLAMSLPIAALPVGVLPDPGYGSALLVMGGLSLAIVAAGLWWGRGGLTLTPAIVAGTGLGVLVLDAARGWPAMVTPIVGGGALEGARFFGLGNVYAGVLLGSAVLVAALLPTAAGAALLAGAGFFAGLPRLGSNLGAAVALFAAAGLWIAVRTRGRLGPREVLLALGATAAGTAAVVAVHLLLPAADTHIAGVVGEGDGLGDWLRVLVRRLGINLRVTGEVPAAWLVPPALAGAVVLAWRRMRPLDRLPAWRHACVVLGLSALVGFLVNDTGIAVGGLAFASLAGALAYPALEDPWTRT